MSVPTLPIQRRDRDDAQKIEQPRGLEHKRLCADAADARWSQVSASSPMMRSRFFAPHGSVITALQSAFPFKES